MWHGRHNILLNQHFSIISTRLSNSLYVGRFESSLLFLDAPEGDRPQPTKRIPVQAPSLKFAYQSFVQAEFKLPSAKGQAQEMESQMMDKANDTASLEGGC
ncbi:unnamed protein product [Cuscuta epithymum]|uniref:Uncharacterized protein n=1 Tax=Cuscuta epithymum TaxID=186058 RepID=A0AAV0F8H0_9ASTE|nr:unnamed protein product [Cuscuta epithymum]